MKSGFASIWRRAASWLHQFIYSCWERATPKLGTIFRRRNRTSYGRRSWKSSVGPDPAGRSFAILGGLMKEFLIGASSNIQILRPISSRLPSLRNWTFGAIGHPKQYWARRWTLRTVRAEHHPQLLTAALTFEGSPKGNPAEDH